MVRLLQRVWREKKRILFAQQPSDFYLRKRLGVNPHFNPNLVPVALFELRKHRPLSVAVYGSDFYLGKYLYGESSPDRARSDDERVAFLENMFASHDQVMQYRVCRVLMDSGS